MENNHSLPHMTPAALKAQKMLLDGETIPIAASARRIHDDLMRLIAALCSPNAPDPDQDQFVDAWQDITTCFARYQKEIVTSSGLQVLCRQQCSFCCNHWVEDVYSFEAVMIARHIRDTFPRKIPAIVTACRADAEALYDLDTGVDRQLAKYAGQDGMTDIDAIDLLLASFYQLKKPCPLLSGDGRCMIYDMRPLTCRIYVSFSDPALCAPERITDDTTATYLLDMEEEASEMLDELHRRYDCFDGDMGLRSLLLKLLGPVTQ